MSKNEQIKDYDKLKKIIESCHLNFLVGSGISAPFLKTLHNVEELLTELSQKEENEARQFIDGIIKKSYFDKSIKGNIELISGPLKSNQDDLNEVSSSICNFLRSIHTILQVRKNNLITKQANIFTTNMDLFLEHSLESENISFNDGFTGRINPKFGTENFHNSIIKTSPHYELQSEVPLFNVFKLHGSVNWKLEDKNIVYDNGFSILHEVIKRSECLDLFGAPEIPENKAIEKLYNAVEKKDLIDMEYLCDFVTSYDKLQMINPTKEKFEKTTTDVFFYELLRMYSNHLERVNSVLFVMGFSFADEHIREMTKRVAKANPTLQVIIFAYDEDASTSISRNIIEAPNIKIYAGTGDEKFTVKNINEILFDKLAKECLNDR